MSAAGAKRGAGWQSPPGAPGEGSRPKIHTQDRSRRLSPIGFHLTGGEASDSRNFEVLLDLGPDVDPPPLSRRGPHDAKTNREAARKRGICPVIPYRSNTIDKPKFFAKVLYKARARIEQMMGKIKRFKRIALRCEKTATNYSSFLALVCGFILIKSVHTA